MTKNAYINSESKKAEIMEKPEVKVMWSLDCSYYTREFESLDELISDIVSSGMDPNYEITKNGKGIREIAFHFISG